MEHLSFWILSVALPLVVLTGNAITRWAFGMSQSAAADLILLFWVFDGTVAIQADEIMRIGSIFSDVSSLRSYFIVILVVSVFLWMISVFKIERQLNMASICHTSSSSPAFAEYPLLLMICYFSLTILVVALNMAPFTLKVRL